MNKFLRRTLKVIGWTVVGIIALLLLVVVLIQVPSVQNFAKGKIVSYLNNKLGTKVVIGHLSIAFPKKVVLEDIYFEDQQKDTLLAGKKLAVDISMFKLIHSEVEINDIELEGIRANIYRKGTDSFFNYDYIVKAFTTPSATPKPADTSGMKINIDHIQLSKILATFRDDQSGADMYVYLGDLETKIKKFDLDHLDFNIARFRLEHVIARIYQHKPLVQPKPEAEVVANNTGAPQLGLELGKIKIGDVDLDYGDDVGAMHARVKIGNMSAEPDKIDLPKLQIALKNFVLENTDATIALGNTPESHVVEQQVNASAAAQVSNPWRFSLAKLSLANNHIKFDNNQRPHAPKGMDYAHMDISNLNMDASNLIFTPTDYSGDVAQLGFSEQSGFNLKKLHTSFLYGEHGVQLTDLLVETDKTIIRDKIEAAWPNLTVAQLADHIGDLLLRVNLDNSKIALSDVLTFLPTMASMPPFYHNENAVFAINAKVQDYVKDLDISMLEASGMSNTSLKMHGAIKGLPDPKKTSFDITIAQLRSTQSDLQKLLPAAAISSIRIPESIAAEGYFKGSMNDFNTKLGITTSRGNAEVLAHMRNMNSYDIKAGVGNLDLGYILKQEQNVGKVSAKVAAAGTGFDPKTMVAKVQMNVFAAYAKGYNYRDLNVDAKLDKGNIVATAGMHDPNLSFNVNAAAVMKGNFPALKMNLQLDSANFQALNLYNGDLRVHGHVDADFSSTNPDNLIGSADISDLIVFNAGTRYATTDTITIAASNEADGRHLRLNSTPLTLDLTGQYKLTEIAAALQHTINRYYKLPGYKETPFAPQQWTLDATVHPSPLLFTFAPSLKGTDSINATVNYNSTGDDLKIAADGPKIVSGAIVVDSLRLRASTGEALNYALTLNSAGNQQFKVNHTSLSGKVADNQLTTQLDINDASGNDQYKLGATINQIQNNGYQISLDPGLMLDHDIWNVGEGNFIRYSDAGLVIHNFSMSNGVQSISAASTTDATGAPIDVRFANFKISTLTKIAEQDSLLVDGIINGTAELRDPTKNLTFTSDLSIDDLSYKQDTVGKLTIKVNNETAQTLAANVQIVGHGNDIRLDGRYFLDSKKIDMNLNLVNVALASIKPFAAGQLLSADGSIKGQMAVKGTLDAPSVDGSIRFDSAHITPTLLGERFALTNDAINVNATGIHFNQFTIADSSNNTAKIDGDILTKDFKNFRFAMNVTADNFQAVNSKRGVTHQPFYGKLNISTKTKIGGDLNLPVINSYVRINKNTDFSYVLPSTDPEVQSREGVVKFIDVSATGDSAIFKLADDSVAKAPVTGIDLTATIETDSAANFNVVIDERNGDAIHIRGTANLEADIDRSGKISLTGSYVLQDGSYLLTLNFLKRQFHIKPGSVITWDGDPTHATVDITAIYVANTAPIDLVEHQLSGRSQYEINQYKQRVPFNVLLNMKGELMKPVISFDIELPERQADRLKDVDAKLDQVRADESELNKQVFALLLLGHFVNENPLESNGTPTTAESIARESASKILTDQLNKLASGLVKGVDLNFGVNSGTDYSTGDAAQRTDLTVGVSKRLLNDRLKVNVGSSFGIEGPTAPNQQASNIAGDVSLDYQLSKDGRYVIRAYRRNDYEGLVEGQVIETGATFIFKIDYDKFNEFFKKPKK